MKVDLRLSRTEAQILVAALHGVSACDQKIYERICRIRRRLCKVVKVREFRAFNLFDGGAFNLRLADASLQTFKERFER
jgi:hypothetical protein